MLSVDHAFVLPLCDFNRGYMQSREVIQTFNRTSLSDRASKDFGNLAKIQGRTQTYHVPAPKKCQEIIVLCYLDSGIGSINIATEDLSRHQFSQDVSVNVKIIFRTNEKVLKINISYN